ncbi:MAG: NUDIX hydrolase [Epulopiscium sp.]|nr:NUDIX hydrolase [Candidatus Epulonipiscium sp.]
MNFPMHIVAVGGLVTNDKDEILLIRDERRGWIFPGGQVEVGESLIEALIREIKEECGVAVKPRHLVGLYSNTSMKKGYNGIEMIPTIVNIDFICDYICGELTTSNESLEVRWFSREEAKKIVTFQKYIERFDNMLNYNGSIHICAFKEPFEWIDKMVIF